MSSFPDLCELSDIKTVYQKFPSTLNGIAKANISRITNDIYNDLKFTEIPDDDKLENMKWACVFKVLTYLETLGLVEGSSQNISRLGDGDFNIMYKDQPEKGVGNIPRSYEEWYGYYFRKLLPRPPLGSRNNWRRGSYGGRSY
jgi:hypothetical protein